MLNILAKPRIMISFSMKCHSLKSLFFQVAILKLSMVQDCR